MPSANAALVEEIISRTSVERLRHHIEIFSEHIGPRPGGSVAEWNAAVYTYNELASYGLPTVMEEFDVFVDRPVRTRIKVVEPEPRLYICESLAWSSNTGPEGLVGEVIDVGYGTIPEFEALGEAVRGKIALARAGKVWRGGVIRDAEKCGAVGVIWVSKGPNWPLNNLGTCGVHVGNPLPNTSFPKLPGIGISYEDGHQVAAWTREGPVVVRMESTRERGWERSLNVIARLEGSRYPDQIVSLGAHYDEWSCGAYDAGSQVGAMLEMARAMVEVRDRIERTVQFCGWGAHEHGLIGSLLHAYELHADEVRDQVVSHVNVSTPVGTLQQKRGGLRTHTSPELLHVVKKLIDRYGWAEGWTEVSPYWDASDHIGFYMQGVPSGQLRGWYLGGTSPYYHSVAADTLRTVVFDEPSIHDLYRLDLGVALYTANGPISPIDYTPKAREFVEETERLQEHAMGRLDFAPLREGFERMAEAGSRIRGLLDRLVGPEWDGAGLDEQQRSTLEALSLRYVSYGKTLAQQIYDYRRARAGEQVLEAPTGIGLIPVFLAVDELSKLAPESVGYQKLHARLSAEIVRLSGLVEGIAAGLDRDAKEVAGLVGV